MELTPQVQNLESHTPKLKYLDFAFIGLGHSYIAIMATAELMETKIVSVGIQKKKKKKKKKIFSINIYSKKNQDRPSS